MIGRSFVFLCLVKLLVAQQIVLKWQNPVDYVEKTDSAENPFGFHKGVIGHPPENRIPIVVRHTDLDNKYVKIWAETVDAGAAICVKDDDTGPVICGQGSLVECYAPSQSELKWEFYCGESCQSSDVTFYYKFEVSPEAANDQWCSDVEDLYPSDKRPLPPVIPTKKATPKNIARVTSPSASNALLPTVAITFVGLLIALFL